MDAEFLSSHHRTRCASLWRCLYKKEPLFHPLQFSSRLSTTFCFFTLSRRVFLSPINCLPLLQSLSTCASTVIMRLVSASIAAMLATASALKITQPGPSDIVSVSQDWEVCWDYVEYAQPPPPYAAYLRIIQLADA